MKPADVAHVEEVIVTHVGPDGRRGARHGPGATLGADRGAARPARRGGGGPGALLGGDPPRRGGLPTGKTFAAWEPALSSIPAPTQAALRTLERVGRHDSLVCGPSGIGPDVVEGLDRLVNAAHEKRSVAASSNLHPAGFDEIMPKTLATATVDRLLHHAHPSATRGESVRLVQATAGKGVTPLA